jgi:predicted nucleic acid-binding Zn ribbon protein
VRDRPNRTIPLRMGDVVHQLMMRRGYARVLAASEFHNAWIAIVGESIGKSTRLGALKAHALEIFVENSLLLQELTFRKGDLLQQLQSRFPEHPLRELKFRVGSLD